MIKNAIALILIFGISGCASADKMKTLPQQKLYFSKYASEGKKQILRQEIVRRHPEWSEQVRQSVLKGEIFTGMTKDQVLSSFGKPLEILRTQSEERDHALWIYPKTYLIFDHDNLINIEKVIRIEFKQSFIEGDGYEF